MNEKNHQSYPRSYPPFFASFSSCITLNFNRGCILCCHLQIYFVNRFDLDRRQMNMLNGFEYNSNSSCYFLKGKKQNFPSSFFFFFSLPFDTHAHSFVRSLFLVEKKKKRKEQIEVVRLPAAAAIIFFVITPSVALNDE